MKAELINPFAESTINVLKTMSQTEVVPGKPSLKSDNKTRGVITGIIGMAGDQISGNMILSFDAPAILGIVSRMLMEEFKEVNDDVVDAVGELTNMISGGAKNLLSKQGYNFAMATPMTLRGETVEIRQLSPAPIITIPFETPEGKVWVEANLGQVTKA
ncbi:MAG: chemotaxis protein CheX [Bdellovibrionales bacterium]|nr:chemotaxis protein CheX [Bdellovibrionales bacterium]